VSTGQRSDKRGFAMIYMTSSADDAHELKNPSPFLFLEWKEERGKMM
jgi:hypothetical protein